MNRYIYNFMFLVLLSFLEYSHTIWQLRSKEPLDRNINTPTRKMSLAQQQPASINPRNPHGLGKSNNIKLITTF